MKAEFSKVLSILRHEKGISQRKAASDLKISQALLSHYENGVREPGLDFVGRACCYYGVSSDFLLGLDPLRAGRSEDDAQEHRPQREGDAEARRIISVLGTIFQLLSAMGDDRVLNEATRYIKAPVYKLYRYIRQYNADMETGTLEVPGEQFGTLCDVEMRLAEMDLCQAFRRPEPEGPDAVHFKKHMRQDLPIIGGLLEELLGSEDKAIADQFCKEKP